MTVITALVREAEAAHRHDNHAWHVANLYRILSTIGKIEYITPHLTALFDAIQAIHRRVLYSKILIGVNKDVIRSQIECNYYEPIRELRQRNPETRHFIEFDDPVVYADIQPAESSGAFWDGKT